MRLIFMGTGAFGGPALRALRNAGHEIAGAISQPDRAAKRGLSILPTPIHALADELGVPHIQAADVNEIDLGGTFGGIDAALVIDFGQKIGPRILDLPRLGCINIHASLLPRYRGAAPFQWAIINGDRVTGVTAFRLNARWDAGDIVLRRETAIGETETADELHDRLAVLGADLIIEALSSLERGDARPIRQDAALASRAPKLSKADGVVDWAAPAEVIVRRIHGLWSWPAVAATFAAKSGKTERVQLARARVVGNDSAQSSVVPPGTIDENGFVQAGRGRVELLEVKPAGGRLMAYGDFARGRRVQSGDQWLPTEKS